MKNSTYNYSLIPEGFYDKILENGHPVRKAWHYLKFTRIVECLPENKESIMDIGCAAGSFLSLVPQSQFSYQVGVDIMKSQVNYANFNFGTNFRKFVHIKGLADLKDIKEKFDCITLIEVIEHLQKEDIVALMDAVLHLLKIDGRFIISTPNYVSLWPILEFVLDRVSDVKYCDQHVTKFNFFNIKMKLRKIYPLLDKKYELMFKTTTHFLAPFLAFISQNFAHWVSRLYKHQEWKLPFGNLIIIKLRKIAD